MIPSVYVEEQLLRNKTMKQAFEMNRFKEPTDCVHERKALRRLHEQVKRDNALSGLEAEHAKVLREDECGACD